MKSDTVRFRVTLDELLSIDEKAISMQMSRSEFLRKTVFEKELIWFDFSGLDELSNQIGKIGVNINQIAKKLNQGDTLDQENAEFLLAALELIHTALKKIYEDTMKKKEEI